MSIILGVENRNSTTQWTISYDIFLDDSTNNHQTTDINVISKSTETTTEVTTINESESTIEDLATEATTEITTTIKQSNSEIENLTTETLDNGV